MKNIKLPKNYSNVLEDIKTKVLESQYSALKVVNKELIKLYWEIGKEIDKHQTKDPKFWGKAIVERLAFDLQNGFPGVAGFSERNIWRMRDFYTTYKNDERIQKYLFDINWTNNLLILGKCKDKLEREFYIRMSKKYSWSSRALAEYIEDQIFEKTMIGQTNFEKTLPANLINKAKLSLKDEYTFDFLELGPEHDERELEESIITKVGPFLREMGGSFAFITNQFRLDVDGEEYFIDLLLYHRLLKCLVAIELKVGKFIPEYAGKMQFYLTALDMNVKSKDENPSIGIILCKTKKETIVEYTLRETNKPIGVVTYKRLKSPPKELRDKLPTLEQIEKLLEDID